MPEQLAVRRGSPHADISTRAVQVLRDYTGRGPTMARTTIAEDLVAIVFGDSLLKAEKSLVRDGKADLVMKVRHEFQLTMRADLCAIVEDVLGRKVTAFMSDNHTDPDVAVEVFILESKPAAGQDGGPDGASPTGAAPAWSGATG